jgi:hypothetical protein
MGFGRHTKDTRPTSEIVRTKLDIAQMPRTKARKAPRHRRRKALQIDDRGDWTPLELFLAGVQRLEERIGAMLCHRRVSDS